MYVLNRKEMRYFDASTINRMKLPGRILMENAGKGCSDYINQNIINPMSKVIIFCGSGNNGGDGFVIARWLKNYGHKVVVVLIDDLNKMSEETKANHDLLIHHDVPVFRIPDFSEWENINMNLNNFDLIIDAMFGIGFKGVLKGWIINLIKEINAVKTPVVAIDIPSGVDCDTGLAEDAVKAKFTLTMANYKLGHFLGKGRSKSGKIVKVNIGIPSKLYEEYIPKAILVTKDIIKYPKREQFSHKGDFGRIGIIAGSKGFTGAAVLACQAALFSGAGLITLFHEKTLADIFEKKLTEVMTQEIPEKDNQYDFQKFSDMINCYDALLIGPGWGTSDKNAKLLIEILMSWNKPLVLDADAINILSKNTNIIRNIKNKEIVITPHYGEFARLIHKSVDELTQNPINLAKEFAFKSGIKVLLKSNTTIFTDGKIIKINITGNDGLATGGSGDVLSGIIVSFLGQKLPIDDAPISASFLLGNTAENLAKKRETYSITPSQIIENLFV